MIDKILEYSGVIFAAVGIICLFLEAFEAFKKKYNSKLTITGLVFLTVSVIGFIVTEILLRDADIPSFVIVVWIVLLWGYLICNIVSAVLVTRKNKIAKRNGSNQIDSPDAVDIDVAQNEQIVENNSQNK